MKRQSVKVTKKQILDSACKSSHYFFRKFIFPKYLNKDECVIITPKRLNDAIAEFREYYISQLNKRRLSKYKKAMSHFVFYDIDMNVSVMLEKLIKEINEKEVTLSWSTGTNHTKNFFSYI